MREIVPIASEMTIIISIGIYDRKLTLQAILSKKIFFSAR